MSAIDLRLDGPEHTQALAAMLAKLCLPGDCVLLHGDLGSGKTTFARGFIRALCNAEDEIVSPTFTLAQAYEMRGGGTLWHFDLYRLKHAREADEIGLDEALQNNISLIEWPEVVEKNLPSGALHARLAYGDSENSRNVTFEGEKRAWGERLSALARHEAAA